MRVGEPRFKPKNLNLSPSDKRPRPEQNDTSIFESFDEHDDNNGAIKLFDAKKAKQLELDDKLSEEIREESIYEERRSAERRVLENKFGELTDDQFYLARTEGGFLVSVAPKKAGEQKQAVALRFEPVKTSGVITGWKVAEISGPADLGVYVDDVLKLDLYFRGEDTLNLKKGLDTFIQVAGNQASPLTKEMHRLKEATRAQRKEYFDADGFEAMVRGGKVKLRFGQNKKGEQTVQVVGVSGKVSYSKGMSYTMNTVPQELRPTVNAELERTKGVAA